MAGLVTKKGAVFTAIAVFRIMRPRSRSAWTSFDNHFRLLISILLPMARSSSSLVRALAFLKSVFHFDHICSIGEKSQPEHSYRASRWLIVWGAWCLCIHGKILEFQNIDFLTLFLPSQPLKWNRGFVKKRRNTSSLSKWCDVEA